MTERMNELENVISDKTALSEAAEAEKASAEEQTEPEDEKEVFVPVKFNKEIRRLDLKEAARLAGLGLKFEAVSDDYDLLRSLAANDGHSVSEYLARLQNKSRECRHRELTELCGGNGEIADYVMQLEGKSERDDGFDELQNEFPNIKSPNELPETVVENAALRGTRLLDEYLRYLHAAKRDAKRAADIQKNAELASLGSQTDRKGGINPETAEFLKGLWR